MNKNVAVSLYCLLFDNIKKLFLTLPYLYYL